MITDDRCVSNGRSWRLQRREPTTPSGPKVLKLLRPNATLRETGTSSEGDGQSPDMPTFEWRVRGCTGYGGPGVELLYVG
jgi:hypothetical protein